MELLLLSLILLLAASCNGKKQDTLIITDCTGKPPFTDVEPTKLYYRIVSMESSCMHIAWSVKSYPTLYTAYTEGIESCMCNASTYNATHPVIQNGSNFTIPGSSSDFSVLVVFKGLFEFGETEKNDVAGGLNLTVACNPHVYADNVSCSYMSLNDDSLTWTFDAEKETFIGTYDGLGFDTYKNQTRFSIRTHVPKVIGGERLKYFPRTFLFENSTTFDITSENYPFVNSNSRLALEVLLIHGENVKNGSVAISRTLDDEYTPSVFSSYAYHTSGALLNETRGGYIQWKPISYQSSSRKSTSSQQLHFVPADTPEVTDCRVTEMPPGLAYSLYGSDFDRVGNVTHWFVVFGTGGDATYLSPNYNTWTAVVGTGELPTDKLSTIIKVAISVGLGIPVVLVLISAVYVFIKKKPWDNVNRWMNSRSGRGYSKLP